VANRKFNVRTKEKKLRRLITQLIASRYSEKLISFALFAGSSILVRIITLCCVYALAVLPQSVPVFFSYLECNSRGGHPLYDTGLCQTPPPSIRKTLAMRVVKVFKDRPPGRLEVGAFDVERIAQTKKGALTHGIGFRPLFLESASLSSNQFHGPHFPYQTWGMSAGTLKSHNSMGSEGS